MVSTIGNPDEIVLDPEALRKQQSEIAQQRAQTSGAISALVTPSKPNNSWAPAPMQRLQNQTTQNAKSALNGGFNPSTAQGQYESQKTAAPGPTMHQNVPNAKPASAVQPQPNQDLTLPGGGQAPVKREPTSNVVDRNVGRSSVIDSLPPGGSQSADGQRPPSTGATFFSARAVDMLRENPNIAPSGAPQFDPHAESPSIRKTAGVDHSKSLPILRPGLAGGSPAANQGRDFVNPSSDMHRKIGAPGGGIGSPLSRGQWTSSYRPLTRPSAGPQNNNINNNGKRPPLGDVTNANSRPGGNGNDFVASPGTGISDPKKQRVEMGDSGSNGLPQHPQN